MPETMTKLEQVPDWITAICHEIDTLVFTHAFDRFTPDAEMIFGTELCRGADEMKKFFFKIDSPLSSKHEIFHWMVYADADKSDRLQTWRVTAGPGKTSAVG